MIGFSANAFHHGTTFLAALETSLGLLKWVKDTDGKGPINVKYTMEAIEPELDAVIKTLTEMGLPDCGLELTRAKNTLRRHLEDGGEDPRHLFDSYRRRMHDSLKRLTFLTVSEYEKAMIAPSAPIFGDTVQAAFPSAAVDISEASKALTFTLFTATVFHCMRACEVALRSLSDSLNVDHKDQNWGRIIAEIEKAIQVISSKTHGDGWRDVRQFSSEAATHFKFLKDALRNEAMHSNVIYSSQQAIDIFNSTRALLQHLSLKLRE